MDIHGLARTGMEKGGHPRGVHLLGERVCGGEGCALVRVLDEYRKQVEVNQRVIGILCEEVARLGRAASGGG